MIRLKQLLKEETFTATNKSTGKTSVFKSKDSRDAAIKAGTHDAIKDKGQPAQSAPKVVGSDLFGGDYAKDRGMDSSDDEFKGTYDLADVADSIKDDIDDSDADGKELKARLDKGESGKYNQTSETGGVIEFANGDKYEVGGTQDGPYPVTKVGTKSSNVAAKSQYNDPTYWKDEKKYYDEEDDVQKTSDRLDKVEKALSDDLKLEDNGFETTRESGGGAGGWEGPMTIIDKNSDYDNGYNCLSIGSGENDGKFSIGFYNQDGEPIFDDEDYGSLTGEKVLSAKQTYKIGKALMGMPEVQKFIKGEITSDEFAAVHDKIKSKLNKSTNEGIIRLTNLLKEGLGPDNAMVAAISDALKKELGVDNVKVKKYSQGRARQGYDFYPDGTKGGLYIDEAYDGTWNIYTTKANGFPNHNHWDISTFPVDIEDKQTALKAALAVIKKFKKDLQ